MKHPPPEDTIPKDLRLDQPSDMQNLPQLPPDLSLLTPEEIRLFTTKNPFIYKDSAYSRSRHAPQNLSSKLIVCLAVYFVRLGAGVLR